MVENLIHSPHVSIFEETCARAEVLESESGESFATIYCKSLHFQASILPQLLVSFDCCNALT